MSRWYFGAETRGSEALADHGARGTLVGPTLVRLVGQVVSSGGRRSVRGSVEEPSPGAVVLDDLLIMRPRD